MAHAGKFFFVYVCITATCSTLLYIQEYTLHTSCTARYIKRKRSPKQSDWADNLCAQHVWKNSFVYILVQLVCTANFLCEGVLYIALVLKYIQKDIQTHIFPKEDDLTSPLHKKHTKLKKHKTRHLTDRIRLANTYLRPMMYYQIRFIWPNKQQLNNTKLEPSAPPSRHL